ncbi:CBS domain-containing protein [Fuchsiella alkaliacetigena]|nr:CBS domain-containing protein [Fuchsiella alkaliacetigena]
MTSQKIAEKLDLTRGALRSDLSVLTMASILEAKPNVGYFCTHNSLYLKDLDELYSQKVAEIKSVPTIIKEETSVYEAIVTLFLEDVGSLFVIGEQDEALAGVISRKDLLKIMIGETDINQIPVSIVMTRMPNIITVSAENTILTAAQRIVDYEVDSLPVVENLNAESKAEDDGKLKVVGRVSKTDITKAFVDFALDT